MASLQPQNAQSGPASTLPPVVVHNFTPLELPETVSSGHRLDLRKSSSLSEIYPLSILVVAPDTLKPGEDYAFLFQHVGVMLWNPEGEEPWNTTERHSVSWVDIRLSRNPTRMELDLALSHMVRLLELKENALKLHNLAAITETRNRQLNQIGVALMSERNLDSLLNLLLDKAMAITGSDAGCLYLVESMEGVEERADDWWANRQIRFKLTRNRSVAIDFTEHVMAPSRTSIVGNAMILGKPLNIPDVYAIPPESEFHHNSVFDQTSGYRTRSMLTVPMRDRHGQIIGAIQLINKSRMRRGPVTSVEAADEQVVPFRQDDVNISLSLASQASVAILNAQYERDIRGLFEGFINASVIAIESRDPTTSGHSHRVATSCVLMARAVTRQETGKYRDVSFTESQLTELRYAALLHDFGKIGVREHVLVKSKKLFPEELERIRHRVDLIKRTIQWEAAEDRVRALKDRRPEAEEAAALKAIGAAETLRLEEVEEFFASLRKANEPVPFGEDLARRLKAFEEHAYRDLAGGKSRWLEPSETTRLLIPRGTLSPEERHEIESHVSHTFRFLAQIPWTPELKQVPHIAHAHHEKMDGSGYPLGLLPQEIPLQSQIMTICDIYDAVTAADRPYKRAIPVERALNILGAEVKEGKIESNLFQIFLEARIWQAIQGDT